MKLLERLHDPGVRGAVLRRPRRRALWHQRLIEAEAGFRVGLRTSSVLFVHAFAACMAVLSGVVLGLPLYDWLLIGLSLAATVTAELFNAAVDVLAAQLATEAPETARQARRLATAGTLTTVVAALVTTLVVIGQHIWRLAT